MDLPGDTAQAPGGGEKAGDSENVGIIKTIMQAKPVSCMEREGYGNISESGQQRLLAGNPL